MATRREMFAAMRSFVQGSKRHVAVVGDSLLLLPPFMHPGKVHNKETAYVHIQLVKSSSSASLSTQMLQ